MIINKPIKTTGESIDYLNKAVFGEDPDYTVLSRVYESSIPIQDRVNDLETNRVNEATVEALQAKVESLEALTTMFANLAYPVPNLVANGDFKTAWTPYGSLTTNTVSNNIATIKNTTQYSGIRNNVNMVSNDLYYVYATIKSYDNKVELQLRQTVDTPFLTIQTTPNNEFTFYSGIGSSNNITVPYIAIVYIGTNFQDYFVKNVGTFNVSQMKLKGVKADNGTPFTLLTNAQIKTQLDLWMATQFPLEVLLQMNS